MLPRDEIKKQLKHTISQVNCTALGKKIPGKVRDSFVVKNKTGEEHRIIVTTDRLSAFDRVLTTIPFKGQLLNQLAIYWFEQTKDIVPNHVVATPHPNVLVARQVEILPVEVVVRGYLAGSAWRDYTAGNLVSGVKLPSGLKKSERFATPILTPSTKAEMGLHDEPISSEEVVQSGLVDKDIWEQVSGLALKLFARGTEKAKEQGLILVDSKYEFGLSTDSNGKKHVVLADEIHTQDSTRYWKQDSYAECLNKGEDPIMLDKEFVRRWLIEEHNYMGDGEPPVFNDDFRVDTASKYIEAYETITGLAFTGTVGAHDEALNNCLESLARDYA